MDKNEVAKLLKISVRQIDYLRQSGELACVKIGRSVRFRSEDVENFLQRRVTVPVEKNQKGGVS
jgi:excisionase family DNA binding protein